MRKNSGNRNGVCRYVGAYYVNIILNVKYCALDKYSKKGCFKFTVCFLALAHTKMLVLLTLLLKYIMQSTLEKKH